MSQTDAKCPPTPGGGSRGGYRPSLSADDALAAGVTPTGSGPDAGPSGGSLRSMDGGGVKYRAVKGPNRLQSLFSSSPFNKVRRLTLDA